MNDSALPTSRVPPPPPPHQLPVGNAHLSQPLSQQQQHQSKLKRKRRPAAARFETLFGGAILCVATVSYLFQVALFHPTNHSSSLLPVLDTNTNINAKTQRIKSKERQQRHKKRRNEEPQNAMTVGGTRSTPLEQQPAPGVMPSSNNNKSEINVTNDSLQSKKKNPLVPLFRTIETATAAAAARDAARHKRQRRESNGLPKNDHYNTKNNNIHHLTQGDPPKNNTDNISLDNDSLDHLYQSMLAMYGDMQHPIVLGLDTCAAYRQAIPVPRRYTAVAGLFNTGTNAMQFHLQHNLRHFPYTWQVPWGKHRLPSLTRLLHVASNMENATQSDALPIVMVRDPFHWMQSMCKSAYATEWKRRRKHCPNLVPTRDDYKKFGTDLRNPVNVTVTFDQNQIVEWESLIHFYNGWNREYVFKADYPRLIVRFEDMLLHAPAMLEKIAECVGASVTVPFAYQVKSAKDHGSHTNLTDAIFKMGDLHARTKQMTREDITYAVQHLDVDLMQSLQYVMPPLMNGKTSV